MVRSLRATAMRATILGFPRGDAAVDRRPCRTGLWRLATMSAAMKRAVRDGGAAAADEALAAPLAGLAGAGGEAGRARRSGGGRARPSSGSSAISVRAMIVADARAPRPADPPSRARPASRAPGRRCRRRCSASSFCSALMQRGRCSCARARRLRASQRWRSATIISMIWRAAGDEIGEQPRLPRPAAAAAPAWSPRRSGRSPRRRSDRSWRACRAPGRSARTCAGLTTTTGRPAAARLAATTVSKPPVASTATSARRQRRTAARPAPRGPRRRALTANALAARHAHARPADPSIHRCRHTIASILTPPCAIGLRIAAQATVRVRWNGGRRPTLRHGLQGPRVRRSPVRHRTDNASRCGAS